MSNSLKIPVLDVTTDYVVFRKIAGYGFVPNRRDDAKLFGLDWYKTNHPCSSGHHSVRSTNNGHCLVCKKSAEKPVANNSPQYKYEIEGVVYYKAGVVANLHKVSSATVVNRCRSERFEEWKRTRIEN